MKKKLSVLLPLFLCPLLLMAALTGCGGQTQDPPGTSSGQEPVTPPEPGSVKIRSISELNREGERDDHANEPYKTTSVERNFRESSTLNFGMLGANDPHYPRIRKMANGYYILTYMEHQYGSNILYVRSKNLLTWSAPMKLFGAFSYNDGSGDQRKYMNGDVVVLDGGDVLAFSSFRADKGYRTELQKNGIAMKRSADNGVTWSEEQIIYVGTNWEVHPIQLASGEIQLYFTETGPMIYQYGFFDDRRSSGIGMIRSTDGGKTWTPNVTGAPYQGHHVMQQYVGLYKGIRFYNDQMPAALELHSGKLALAAESYLMDNSYKISLGFSTDNWEKSLGLDEPGPTERTDNLFNGNGPSLAQFDSGETLLSYGTKTHNMTLRIGDSDAKNWADPYNVYTTEGLWGALEEDGSHRVIAVYPNTAVLPNKASGTNTVSVGRLYLNHNLFAKPLTPTIDGDNADWQENTEALFVGSESQAQAAVSVAYDDDNIYFLVERLDNYLEDGDTVTLYLDTEGRSEYYALTLSKDGIASFKLVESFKETDKEPTGIRCAMYVNGSFDDGDGKKDTGVIWELAVPRSVFRFEDNAFRFCFTIENTDKGIAFDTDGFSVGTEVAKSTWPEVKLK